MKKVASRVSKGRVFLEEATDANQGWEKEKQSFVEAEDALLSQWIPLVTKFSSFHGVVWYNRILNRACKRLLFVFIMLICLGLPTMVITNFIEFLSDVDLSDSIIWSRAETIRYPNLTICHPGYFDLKRMEEQGISSDLANFMTIVFDPASPNLVAYHREHNPELMEDFALLGEELDRILEEKSIGLLELMESIAIRCEELVVFCDLHRELYFESSFHSGHNQSCCDLMFNPRPYFTTQGACFVTTTASHEAFPFTWSAIEFWLHFNETASPAMSSRFRGTDALHRDSVAYAFAHHDHPILTLSTNIHTAIPGQMNTIALSVRLISRESLTDDFCEKNPEEFESTFGLPYTKSNCEALFSADGSAESLNCSYLPYFQVQTPNSDKNPICRPQNVFSSPPFVFHAVSADAPAVVESNANGGADVSAMNRSCKFECDRVEYLVRTTYSTIHEKPLVEELQMDPKATAILQFYFETFDYEKHTLKARTLLQFLSDVGGWMGLTLGASVISFVELIYFICIYWKSACKSLMQRGRRKKSIGSGNDKEQRKSKHVEKSSSRTPIDLNE